MALRGAGGREGGGDGGGRRRGGGRSGSGGSNRGGGGGGGRRPRRRSRSRRRGGGGGPGGGGGGRRRKPEGEATLNVEGWLQVAEEGHGFLRSSDADYNPESGDPFVSKELVQEHGLETGLALNGMAIPGAGRNAPWFESIETINGEDPQVWADRTKFNDLVADSPRDRIRLETEATEISTRVVDLIAPIGKGQRCLVVAPPKAGKTVLLQKIAGAISTNHPEIHLIVLLVDERPEEVTDMRRSVQGEVVASSSDELSSNHVQVAEIVMERAKRLVECGKDVVVLLDSITRLARAYNNQQKGGGRVMSGGIDSRTMEKPRRFFGAARNAEGGGSLTVIGTALVDTGSRMDEVIFQEFKGTGNTEIVMDRKLFERRIFPAIDISQSGTRREELLYGEAQIFKINLMRRALARLRPVEAMQLLVGKLEKTDGNEAFLSELDS